MQAAVNNAIAKVVELQGIVDEGAASIDGGVYLRFCKTQKGLYEMLLELKKLARNVEGSPPESTSTNPLVQRFYSDELGWAELSALLHDAAEVDVALLAIDELLMREEPSYKPFECVDDDERTALVVGLVHAAGDFADSARAAQAMGTTIIAFAGCEEMKQEFVAFGALRHVQRWLEDADAPEIIVSCAANVIAELIDDSGFRCGRMLDDVAMLRALLAQMRRPETNFNVRNKLCRIFMDLCIVWVEDINSGKLDGPIGDLAKDLLAAAAAMLTHRSAAPPEDEDDEEEGRQYALGLISAIVSAEPSASVELVDMGAIPILLDAFDDAVDDDRVYIMCTLEAAARHRALRERLVDLGAYKVFATALARHSEVQGITARACNMLRWLTKKPTAPHVELFREAEIPKILVDFVNETPGYCIRIHAVRAVRNLCYIEHKGLNSDLMATGAVQMLRKTLADRYCLDSHKLAQEALDALLALPGEKRERKKQASLARKRAREA